MPKPPPLLPATLLALGALPAGARADEQGAAHRVTIEVAVSQPAPDLELVAVVDWLGEPVRVPLCDDGTCPGDRAFDRVWTGRAAGGRLRVLPIRLLASVGGQELTVIDERLETVYEFPDYHVSYALELAGPRPTARRVAIPAPPDAVERRQVAQLVAWFGWAILAFLYIAWLVGRAVPAARR